MSSYIVFGANGVSGIAMVEHLLSLPASEVSNVLAVSRRAAQVNIDDTRLHFVSSDLLEESSDQVADKIRAQPGGQTIQTVFHYTYVEQSDLDQLSDTNIKLLRVALDAVVAASAKSLRHVHLQLGYKWYGVHLPDASKWTTPQPWREDQPRLPTDAATHGRNFYYEQRDVLAAHAEQHKYAWSESRPNPILGAAKGNYMNLIVSLALFFTVEKAKGAKQVAYPGNDLNWKSASDSDAILIDQSTAANNAAFQFFCAAPENEVKCAGQGFNIHDDDERSIGETFRQFAEYFGLRVTPPTKTITAGQRPPGLSWSLAEWADKDENKRAWQDLAKRTNVNKDAFQHASFAFVDFTLGFTTTQHGSLEKARNAGWTKRCDTLQQGWIKPVQKLVEWGSIPDPKTL